MSITLAGVTHPGYTITLPNMEFGDSDRLRLNAKYTITMSGKTYAYKQSPNHRGVLLRFNKLTPLNVANFLQFIEDTANEQITITTLNGLTYTGILLITTYELATTNLRMNCTTNTTLDDTFDKVLHTVSIQFEGNAA